MLNSSFSGVNIRVVKLPGASINGFGKRDSTLNSRKVFYEEQSKFKPDYICFALGQVDIELGFYFRKFVKLEKLSMNDFIDELCNKYIFTIDNVVEELNFNSNDIIIKGINISVLTKSRSKALRYTSKIINENIDDIEERKKHNEDMKDKFPSVMERYSFHNNFNSKIKELSCGKYKYFDINDVIEDPNIKGQVDLNFIPAPLDHHLVDSLFIRNVHISRLINVAIGI